MSLRIYIFKQNIKKIFIFQLKFFIITRVRILLKIIREPLVIASNNKAQKIIRIFSPRESPSFVQHSVSILDVILNLNED